MSKVSTAQIRHSSFATSAAAVLGLFLAAAFNYAHAVPAADQPSATTRAAAEDNSIPGAARIARSFGNSDT